MYIFTVGDNELPPSEWPFPHYWPTGLPKMDTIDRYAYYIIVFTGKKFYIIDLVYFPTPSQSLQKLLNDPTVVVATFNWHSGYHLLQFLYAEPDKEDPEWETKDHYLFFWSLPISCQFGFLL